MTIKPKTPLLKLPFPTLSTLLPQPHINYQMNMSTTSSSSSSSTSILLLFNPTEFHCTVTDRDEYAEPSSISIEPIIQNPDFEADIHKRFNKKERKQRVEILQKIQQELMTIYMTPIWTERSKIVREECEKGVRDEMERLRGMDKEIE